MTKFLLLVGFWLHATNSFYTWKMWQILQHKILELVGSHSSLQNGETTTHGSAETHWVNLKIRSISATYINKNAHLINEKEIFLIKIMKTYGSVSKEYL